MASKARTPNHDEGLSARSSITGLNEYLLSTNGALNVTGSGGGGGGGTVNVSNSINVSPATQNINTQDSGSTTTTGANNQPITTGTATAGSTASFTLAGYETVLVMVSGIWTGTLISEGSFDGGTTWVSKAVKQIGTGYTTNSLTGNFAGAVNVAGLTNYRIRATAFSGGPATVLIVETPDPHSFYIANNLALRDGVTQSITNTIKAASTAPLATDTSLVVTQSPNSPGATSALQTTGNTSLASIATNTTGLATSSNQTNGNQQVQGNVASSAADSGNPVKVGGTFNSTPPTFTTGQRGDLQLGSRGSLSVSIFNANSTTALSNATITDGQTITAALNAKAIPLLNNGTSFDMARSIATGIQGVGLSDGTNTANILKSDGTFAGNNSQFVAGSAMALTGLTAGSLNADLVPATDMAGFSSFSIQITGAFTGTLTFQQANDLAFTNPVSTIVQSDLVLNNPITSTTVIGMYHGVKSGRYFRVRMTAYSTGAAAGIAQFYTNHVMPYTTVPASQQGTWTAGLNTIAQLADATTSTSANALVQMWNGTGADRIRNNTTGAIIAAGATTAQTSATQVTYNAKRLTVIINISAFTSGTLTFTVNGLTASGYTYPMLVSTALASTGITVLRLFDGATPTANATANESIPRSFNVVVSGTFVATYGVDYNLGV